MHYFSIHTSDVFTMSTMVQIHSVYSYSTSVFIHGCLSASHDNEYLSNDPGPCADEDGEDGDVRGDDQRGEDHEEGPLSPARDVLRPGDDGTLLGQALPLQQQPDERA